MSSIGVALPLLRSSNDGFEMLKTIKETVKQNLKTIILTNPGERIMDPEFGVGIRRFLFEQVIDQCSKSVRKGQDGTWILKGP